jgi:hypothetical protein
VVLKAIFENFGETKRPIVFNAKPLSVSIQRNSYKQADSFSIELDAKDLPIAPAMIRAMGIEVYLYNKASLEQKATIAAGAKGDSSLQVEKLTLRPAVVGIVDDVEVSFGQDGRTLRIDGQDYTTLFTEHQLKERKNLTGLRLDNALLKLIREVDITNQMSLTVEIDLSQYPSTWTLERKLDKALPKVGASVSKTNKKGKPVEKGTPYWDYMYQLALDHGFILFVRDLEIVLALPNDIFDKTDVTPSRQFQLTWGRNITELSMKRHMGKEAVPNIRVACYDDKIRKTVTADSPTEKMKKASSTGTESNEVKIITVSGITDRVALQRYADTVFSLLSKTEQQVSISTKELLDEKDADLVFAKAGDSVKLVFNTYNNEEFRGVFEAAYSSYLQQDKVNPIPASKAQEMARSARISDTFQTPFYVREASIEWSHTDGFSLTLDMMNIVVPESLRPKGEIKVAENAG